MGVCRLESNTVDNNNERSLNNDITNVLEYLKQTNNSCKNCRGNPTNNNPTYVISDTGATQNYIKLYTPSSNKVNNTQGPRVILSDVNLMQANHKAELNLRPSTSTRAKTAHISPQLQSGAIISIGQLFDDGCTATFTSITMTVHKQVGVVV